LPNFHRVLERHGVDYELHTAGDYKRTLTLFGENTEAGREKLRHQLEETHGLFKDFIRDYRPRLDLAQVATGEYWHGRQALTLGLIDEIKTSDDFLLEAADTADLYKVSYATHKKPLDRLLSSLTQVMQRLAPPPRARLGWDGPPGIVVQLYWVAYIQPALCGLYWRSSIDITVVL
jgi:serine protease SohB